jgi:hypothetical protein
MLNLLLSIGVVPSVSKDHVRLQRRVRQLRCARSSRFRLHQLDAIAERVCDIHAKVALKMVFHYLNVGFP